MGIGRLGPPSLPVLPREGFLKARMFWRTMGKLEMEEEKFISALGDELFHMFEG